VETVSVEKLSPRNTINDYDRLQDKNKFISCKNYLCDENDILLRNML